jgi:predicted Zn-dependent protease
LSREEARRLADRVLALSRAEGCQVSIGSGVDGNSRFAANQISTSGDTANAVLTVSSRFGKQQASASTNVFDDAGLKRAVETSERLARLAPENPDLMPLLAPQRYGEVVASFSVTERLDAAQRADAVRVAADACEAAGLQGAGFVHRTAGANAVANSAGLFAHHHSSDAAYTLTVRTPDGQGSGWAGTAHNDWTRMTGPRPWPTGPSPRRAAAASRSRSSRASTRWCSSRPPWAISSA